MAFHVYAHDCGCVDFVDSFNTKAEALAYANRLHDECEQHPSQHNLVAPWFEITAQLLHEPDTYTFPDMSEQG
jgi:hypothetical protein